VKRFKNILFSPLGDKHNPASVRRVADLAARNGAKLTLFGALTEPSMIQRALHSPEWLEAAQEAEEKAMSSKLVRSAPTDLDIEVNTVIAHGNRSLRIIEQVLASRHDLVVVTSDEDDEDHATIKRLLRKCPCPVWVIRRTRARTQRVLAAVDPDPVARELNLTLLELAASMVDLYGGELHVVHAWELYGEATMRSSGFVRTSRAEVESLLRQEEAEHRAAMEELLSNNGLQDKPWQLHLHKGPASDVVCDVVARNRINLLVMGTVARTGVRGLIIGNTAESVVENVRCSVIAVKPPGFVSPVEVAGG
jgi:nucleotide-binding universal stress UspA family protein